MTRMDRFWIVLGRIATIPVVVGILYLAWFSTLSIRGCIAEKLEILRTTYSSIVRCSNCNRNNAIRIKKCLLVEEGLKHFVCYNCKCSLEKE